MATMKAARWHNRKDVRVEEVEIPEIRKEKQVKIAVKYAGICGSDLHEYLGGPIFIPANEPHPYTGEKAPITMGHEFCELLNLKLEIELQLSLFWQKMD